MVILIAGASHTGKTALAQRLLDMYHIPYLSIDHLKMGLIRSGYIRLTPEDDAELEACLWPVVREIVKTAVENGQNLTVEGCYIPFRWREDFDEKYLQEIRYCCLVMSRRYIERHFEDILRHACDVERRIDSPTAAAILEDNAAHLAMCQKYGCRYALIDSSYQAEIEKCILSLGQSFAADGRRTSPRKKWRQPEAAPI